MAETQVFDKIPLLKIAFPALDEDELHEMADLTVIRTYPPGHVLCREGAYEEVFYVIADGKVVITKKMTDSMESERVLRVGGRGDLVGEMAMIQSAPRAATVRTTSECTVLEMEKKDFETILQRSPRMAIDIIRITLDRLRANDQLMIADLQKSNKVLRQLDRNKLEFIQVAAHELRTPLTVLKGYVNVLNSLSAKDPDPVLVDVMKGILKGTDRIYEVVNLMLDVSRIDADSIKAASVPISLRHVIEDIVKDVRRDSEGRNVELIVEHPENPPDFKGDPSLIQKVMYHLIVNAVKYTPDGGKITVTTTETLMERNIPAVQVTVKDTGIGLDPEHHDLVFEKFYQVGGVDLHSSGKTSFKGGGPGLGLAIVKGIVRAHDGKVWVESTGHDEEKLPGSTFYVQLPISRGG